MKRFNGWCFAGVVLVLAASTGCHLAYPYDEPEVPRPDGGVPVADGTTRPPEDGPTVTPDRGKVFPDATPPPCQQREILNESFESSNLSPGWDVVATPKDSEVKVVSQGSGKFPAAPEGGGRYAQFFPEEDCGCYYTCSKRNELILSTPLLDPGGCPRVKVKILFNTDDMESSQGDTLELVLEEEGGTERMRVKLFPDVEHHGQRWTPWEREVALPAPRPLRLKLRHSVQCDNDIAAVDRIRVEVRP